MHILNWLEYDYTKDHYFLITIPETVTILFPYLLLSVNIEIFSFHIGRFRIVGSLPILLGIFIDLWCFWDFIVKGRGTPAPLDPPKHLVVTGLYRYVRNPMYVGVACILFGEALLFESLILLFYGIGILWMFHLFIIWYEEPVLKRRFGQAYLAYCDTVPRWIPKRKHAS